MNKTNPRERDREVTEN